MSSVIDTLITDRTRADVQRAAYLTGLWRSTGWTGTSAELDEWLSGCKGAYNASDRNRVGQAIVYILQRLNAAGYNISLTPKTDWTMEDIPTRAQLTDLLNRVAVIRAVLPLPDGTPYAPTDAEAMTVQEANDIERILLEVDRLLTNSQSTVDLGWALGIASVGLYGGV